VTVPFALVIVPTFEDVTVPILTVELEVGVVEVFEDVPLVVEVFDDVD